MSIFNSEFQKNYKNLFKNVKFLNEYTRSNKVELKGVAVEDVSLDGAEFHGAVFHEVEWKNMHLENSTFTKVVFDSCHFENVKFNGSRFVDCVFTNCNFSNAIISRVSWKGAKFSNCQIEKSVFNKWIGDEALFTGGKILDTPFAEGRIQYTFKDIELDGLQIVLTEGGLPLTVEDSKLSEVDFGDSHFSEIVLRRVQQGEGHVKFNSVTAESISFENVEMLRGVGMGWANVGLVRIIGGQIYGPAFKKANIAKTVIRDAQVTRFAIGHMGKVEVSNSTLHRSGLFEGGIEEFSVVNSTIDGVVGKNFKADTVVWDNVTLDGKIDLTNAQVKDFRPTRLKRGPRLQLITTGSNMRFN